MNDASRPAADRPRRVVFDFDGVFTATDSTAAWLTPRLRAKPGRLLRCLPWLAGFAVSGRRPSIRTWFTQRLLRAAFGAEPPHRLVASLRRFGAVVALDPRFTMSEAVERARAHLDGGDDVVIVSAGLEPLLAGWCEASALPARLCASLLRIADDGRLTLADHCFSHRKVARLAALGWDSWDVVYTDSAHDLPLIAGAREAVLVNPSPDTLRRASLVARHLTSVAWSATPRA